MLSVMRDAAVWIETRARWGVASGGLHLGMAQELADHRGAFPERQRTGSEGVPKVGFEGNQSNRAS